MEKSPRVALEKESSILFSVNYVPDTVLGTLSYPQEIRMVGDNEI